MTFETNRIFLNLDSSRRGLQHRPFRHSQSENRFQPPQIPSVPLTPVILNLHYHLPLGHSTSRSQTRSILHTVTLLLPTLSQNFDIIYPCRPCSIILHCQTEIPHHLRPSSAHYTLTYTLTPYETHHHHTFHRSTYYSYTNFIRALTVAYCDFSYQSHRLYFHRQLDNLYFLDSQDFSFKLHILHIPIYSKRSLAARGSLGGWGSSSAVHRPSTWEAWFPTTLLIPTCMPSGSIP
ncbi:hypothetical protein BJ165DRAFT_1458036, partial [Panaeolus papilionaceus]